MRSNREAGKGRYYICVRSKNVRIPAVILELKLARRYKKLDAACDEALEQIEEKHYAAGLEEYGYAEAICYELGFFHKQMKVKMVRKELV